MVCSLDGKSRVGKIASPSVLLKFGVSELCKSLLRCGVSGRIVRSIFIASEGIGALEGVCYVAVEIPDAFGQVSVSAFIVKVRAASGAVAVAEIAHENDASTSYDCPPYILEVLTESQDECARIWRRLCAERAWCYEIIVGGPTLGDTRSISLVLGRGKARAILVHEADIPPCEFDARQEDLSRRHIMAGIPSLSA